PRDNRRLLDTLSALRDLGNTVLVVEHDEETIRRADYVVDLGPGAGTHGGAVVAVGTPSEVANDPKSITGLYIRGERRIPVPAGRRSPTGKAITIRRARHRGYRPGRLSFNVKGGRCEACEGEGMKRIEMNFLPDVYVRCDVCRGARYNRETLAVTYKGKSIAELLDTTVEEALPLLENI